MVLGNPLVSPNPKPQGSRWSSYLGVKSIFVKWLFGLVERKKKKEINKIEEQKS